ncbi:transglycosylase SLT domain-containing protein [Kaistia granuli]|uniref:transglycosylase SLT domain-containing protein n=1 Tax=Kaistia granuli TaxID=363259 RepID=UPI001FDEE5EC|nr:transglycosylase SLT domain-containing protein [Kaistia granuli]
MRSLLVLLFCVLIPAAVLADDGPTQAEIEARIAHYAKVYGIPFALLRKVVKTESTFNPAARNGPYWGLMQIRHDTAKGLGYRGPASGLLDAETNLIYGGAYLANAYIVAGGNDRRAHSLYKSGYYYEAKRKRLLAKLINVPMGTAPVMVAGRTVTEPAAAAPESGKLVVASLAAKPEAEKPAIAKPATVSVELDAPPAEVAKPVVAKAEIAMPLLPRRRPAALVQLAALVEPKPAPPRGLLYATALVPPSRMAQSVNADQIIAQPELALAGTASTFASNATSAAIALPRAAPRQTATSPLPTAVRLAATHEGSLSDAQACCQQPSAAGGIAAPLPRARPALPAHN